MGVNAENVWYTISVNGVLNILNFKQELNLRMMTDKFL